MTNTRDTIVDWLKDAQAMEEAQITALSNHAKAADGYPQLRSKLEEHLRVTQRQADDLKRCIQRLGSDTSTTKQAIGKTTSFMQGLIASASGDDVVKNCLNDYAAEHMEIASYRSLIAACDEIGDRQTADVCRRICQEEIEMARWLENTIPAVTHDYLMHETARA